MAITTQTSLNGHTPAYAIITPSPAFAACPNLTSRNTNDQQQGSRGIAVFPHYTPLFWLDSSLSPFRYNRQTAIGAEGLLIYSRRQALSTAPVLERLRGLGFDEEKLQQIHGLPSERREYLIRRAYLVKKILRTWRLGRKDVDLTDIPVDEQRGSVSDDLDLVYYGVLKDHDLMDLYGASSETLLYIGGGRGLKRHDMINTLEDVMALRIFQPVCANVALGLLREFMGGIVQYRLTDSHSNNFSNLKEDKLMQLKCFVDCAW